MLKYGICMFSFSLFGILNLWWLYIYCLILSFVLLGFSVSLCGFWSMVSYNWGGDYLSLIFVFLTVWIVMLMLLASISIWWMNLGSSFLW